MDELLALRLGLLGLLLLFVAFVAMSMRTALASHRSGSVVPRARVRLDVLVPAASGLPPGSSIELAGEMTIGRDPSNSIVVADPSVSAEHAAVRLRDDAWLLVDLGSTNGTMLNGVGVDARGRELQAGDRISVGAVVFRFHR